MRTRYLENSLPPEGSRERELVLQTLTAFHKRLQMQLARLINENRWSTNHPRVQALSNTLEKVSRKLYDEEGL